MHDNLGRKTESVKCFTLDFGVKHFTHEALNFTVDQIISLNKHGKMCKRFYFETNGALIVMNFFIVVLSSKSLTDIKILY